MKFNRKQVIYASLVFGWISIFWNVYDQLIQSINAYSFALDPDKSGWVLAIDNVLGLAVLPIFGHFSDKCKNPHGKRTPYIMIGTLVSLVGLAFVGIFASKRMLWPYIVSLFVTLFAMASYRSAGLSLVPDIVYDPDRGRANSISNLVSIAFTVVGIVLALVFMPLKASQSANFMPICLAVIGSSLMVVGVYVLKFNERTAVAKYKSELDHYKTDYPEKYKQEVVIVEELDETQMSDNVFNKIFILLSLFFFFFAYNALVSNFTVYSDFALHFSIPQIPLIFVILGAIPGFAVAVKVTKKLGRKYTIAIGLFTMLAFLLLAMVFTRNTSWSMRIPLLICFIMAGVGYGFAMVNMYPFYLELSKTKNIGQNTGIFAGVSTAAMVVTPILAGYVIKAAGKLNGTTYQIDQIINGVKTSVTKIGDYNVLFPYCAVALALSCICILIVKSDYAKGGLRDHIKARIKNKKND